MRRRSGHTFTAINVTREVSQCPEKAPSRALSLLKAPISAFTFKNLLRHYSKQAFVRYVDIKFGHLFAKVITSFKDLC